MYIPAVCVLCALANKSNNTYYTRHATRGVKHARTSRVVEFYTCVLPHNFRPLSKYTNSHAYRIFVIEHLNEVVRYFRARASRLRPQLTDGCTNSGQIPH